MCKTITLFGVAALSDARLAVASFWKSEWWRKIVAGLAIVRGCHYLHGDRHAYERTWPVTIFGIKSYPDSWGAFTVSSGHMLFRLPATSVARAAGAGAGNPPFSRCQMRAIREVGRELDGSTQHLLVP